MNAYKTLHVLCLKKHIYNNTLVMFVTLTSKYFMCRA